MESRGWFATESHSQLAHRALVLLLILFVASGAVTASAYFASSVNSTLVGSPSFTSISCVVVPALRWAAFNVYLPAGTLEILNVPSLADTPKKG